MQCGFDGAIETFAGVWSEADQSFGELSLPIENKCLRNGVVVTEEEGCQFFVRRCERILNTKLFRKRGHLYFVVRATDV